MDVNEEHVHTLLTMGFPFESEIRKALRFAKNDLNEAVSYLTNENQYLTGDVDVEMKDMPSTSGGIMRQYGPDLPPSYEVALAVSSGHTEEAPIAREVEVSCIHV